MQSRMWRRLGGVLVLATIFLGVVAPAAALADVASPCDGWAEFAGERWTPANDSADNPIIIPPGQDTFEVHYFGSSGFDNNGHQGKIYADLVIPIPIADWEDTNGDLPNDPSKEGDYTIDMAEIRSEARFEPRGLVKVRGNHTADGGSCSGFVMVKFDGPLFDSALASASLGGMVAMLILLILAAFVTGKAAAGGLARGRPILGIIAGLLFGLFLAIFLQQASVWPLEPLTLYGLPVLFLLVGFALGWFPALGRGRVAPSVIPPDLSDGDRGPMS